MNNLSYLRFDSMKAFCAILTFLLLAGTVQANHVFGGNITFNATSENTYEVNLTILTDCFGAISPPPTANLFFLSESGECLAFSGAAELISSTEVSDLVPLEIGQSTCGEGFLPGVFRLEYAMTGDNAVFLNPDCNWRITWNEYDWADFQNISTGNATSAFFETSINQSQGTVEGIAIHDEYVPYMRVDEFEDYQIEYSASIDVELDFEFTATLVAESPVSGVAASYVEPYSAAEPIEAILIDANTGVLSVVSPNNLGPYAVGVQITGNLDGVEVFSIHHSMAIIVRLCDTGTIVLDGELINATTEGAEIAGGDTIFVESGAMPCFSIEATNLVGGELNIQSDFDDYFGEGSSTLEENGSLIWTGCVEQDFPPGTEIPIEYTISGTGGCGDQEYTTWATIIFTENFGCTDSSACNYDDLAIVDDASCLYIDECGDCGGNGIFGCSDPQACNWVFGATCGDETCSYSTPPDPDAVSTSNIMDFLTENGNIGSCGYDLNGDGIVNLADLLILLSWF